MYLVKITLGRLGRRQSLKILRAVYLRQLFFLFQGVLNAQEVLVFSPCHSERSEESYNIQVTSMQHFPQRI